CRMSWTCTPRSNLARHCCTRTCSRRASIRRPPHRPTCRWTCRCRWAMSRPVSPRRTWWWSAPTACRGVLRVPSSRTPPWRQLPHENMFTQGVNPPATTPSNLSVDMSLPMGDVEAGLAEADVVVERTYYVPWCHQGYIEPHAAVAKADENGRVEIWCCTQGPF